MRGDIHRHFRVALRRPQGVQMGRFCRPNPLESEVSAPLLARSLVR